MTTELTTLTKELLARLRGRLGPEWNQAWRELLGALQPWQIYFMHDKYSELAQAFDELLEDSQTLVFRWVQAPPARELLPEGQKISYLAWRSVAQTAREIIRKAERDQRLNQPWQVEQLVDRDDPKQGASVLAQAEGWTVMGIDALNQIRRLEEPHRTTLVREVERMATGNQRSLAQLLGVSAEVARKRLARARRVLVERMTAAESEKETDRD